MDRAIAAEADGTVLNASVLGCFPLADIPYVGMHGIVVVDARTDRVVGCHVVGPDAAELVQGLGIALRCNATKAQFDATVGIHPSSAEELVTMRTKWTPPPEAQAAE